MFNRKIYNNNYYLHNKEKIKEYYKNIYWKKNLYGKIKNKDKNIFKINKKEFIITFS
tara:strand:- start:854 stop:1024 length:171 start_codon:yes stop_codon:yes gene_type:complete